MVKKYRTSTIAFQQMFFLPGFGKNPGFRSVKNESGSATLNLTLHKMLISTFLIISFLLEYLFELISVFLWIRVQIFFQYRSGFRFIYNTDTDPGEKDIFSKAKIKSFWNFFSTKTAPRYGILIKRGICQW